MRSMLRYAPLKCIIISSLICLLPSASVAQNATDQENRVISLHDLLVGALNTNLELRAKRLDPEMQDLRVAAALGAFEPNLVAAASYSSIERPRTFAERTSLIFSFSGGDPVTREDIGRYQTGITGRLPWGTTYEMLTGLDEVRSNTNRFNSEFIANSTINFTQPLLKDFGYKAGLAEVRLQRQAAAATRQELRAVILRVLRDVSNAYHEMAFAQENVAVKEQAVSVAADLVRDNQRRVDEGRMAPIDVTQAQSRLSEAREELLLARNFLAQRRNVLRELTRDRFDENENFLVDGSFVSTAAPATVDRSHALAALYNKNPSYLASVELAKAEDVRIAYAENQNLPRVDLKASYGYNGLGDSLTRSYRNYWEREQPSWSAGVVVNVPVWNKTGRARLSEAKKRKEQALLTIQRTEVALLAALDTAMRDIQNATERVGLVKDTVRLAESALGAELKRLGSGMTTSFNVAQAQRDLSTARSRELATYVDLNKAVTNLNFVLGTLHEELRVNIAD